MDSGLTEDGWIPIDLQNLRIRFPGVYAIGDVTRAGVPKVGVFAESMGRVAAAAIIAEITEGPKPDAFAGRASCYIEFGVGKVGRVDMDFFAGLTPVGTFTRAFDGSGHREAVLRFQPPSPLVRAIASSALAPLSEGGLPTAW